MIDIDPRLDGRLRSFYETIESGRPRRELESFGVLPQQRPHRRTLNFVAGIAGAAIVAAGVGVFATELAGRHNVKPPASASRPALPTNADLTLGLPSISHTEIQTIHGRGAGSLPVFTPQGIVFIQSACNGSGTFSLNSPGDVVGMTADSCDGGVINGVSIPASAAIDGKPLSLKISAAPSTVWEIVVADTGPVAPLPMLGPSTIPSGARILVPATPGVGTTGVQTFLPTGPFYVEYACTGTGSIDFSLGVGVAHFESAPCANGTIGVEGITRPTFEGPTNLTVETPPHSFWEIQVYELPETTT
jgi:hypothetical protein